MKNEGLLLSDACPQILTFTFDASSFKMAETLINRSLISLKRYFAWLKTRGQLTYDPAKVVKLVGEEVTSPRHLDDLEEQALVSAVKNNGNLRDQAIGRTPLNGEVVGN